MELENIYMYEEMDSHLYQVVRATGEVIDRVDILTAEGTAGRLSKRGFKVQWVDRCPSKVRKHVRSLISQFKACGAGCNCSAGTGM